MDTYNLADDNPNVNIKSFILDPLSVIVKLAIIGNKPIGTKILIQNNIISFQEPGYFQGISRIFYKSNKTDIQYLFNPIYLACVTFLSKTYIKDLENYIHEIHLVPQPSFFEPCGNEEIIRRSLRNLVMSFEKLGEHARAEEVKSLLIEISGGGELGL